MLWALVMAGGWGTRLWPLSNRKLPKPLISLIPGKQNLLSETIGRLHPLIPRSRIVLIGNEEHLAGLKQSARGVPHTQIIGEPAARNTAPTVALGASLILKKDPQALILVLPADHWIKNTSGFQKSIKWAARFSDAHERFAIFGIKPTHPSSSYGYMLRGRKIAPSIYQLKRFIEKPKPAKAKQFLKTGKYFWHAGIFLASAANLVASVARYQPRLAVAVKQIKLKNGKVVNRKTFQRLENISIDYAVLEHIKNAVLIHGQFDWCDVGTWNSMGQVWPNDSSCNSLFGDCRSFNSRGNVVYAPKKLVCLQGVQDLVVVDTPDTLYVGQKHNAEGMRKMVKEMTKS